MFKTTKEAKVAALEAMLRRNPERRINAAGRRLIGLDR